MRSLHSSFSMSEIFHFYNKVGQNQEFVIEPKIDGLSLSVEYKNGVLTCASTRGDGTIGEDITENALTIKNLPHKLNTKLKYLEIRGECYMPKMVFKKLNDVRKFNGDKLFKHPRNAASGSIRQKDANICKSRNLQILFFNVQRISNKEFKTHSESLEFLKSLGLPVVDFKKCGNFDEIEKEIENIGKTRDNFTFPIDGAVLKINSLKERTNLGSTSRYPRWAEAFKYSPFRPF
jgi:DNA ligase (NAD+)